MDRDYSSSPSQHQHHTSSSRHHHHTPNDSTMSSSFDKKEAFKRAIGVADTHDASTPYHHHNSSSSSSSSSGGDHQRRSRGSSPPTNASSSVQPTQTIMLRQLPYDMSDTELQSELAAYLLPFRESRIVRHRDTGASRGFGFLEFDTVDEAKRWMHTVQVHNTHTLTRIYSTNSK